MTQKEIILKNFNEFYELAGYAQKSKKFNAAVTLYYKALVELCDLKLLETVGKIGASHSERFRLLEQNCVELYKIADKLFRFYRDTYSKEVSEIIAKSVMENVENAKKIVFK